jgi:hypothetical protein
MGGAHTIRFIMDMQNRRWNNSFRPSDITNDKNNPPYQRLYPGIVYEQTTPSKNHFIATSSGGFVLIKPDSSDKL